MILLAGIATVAGLVVYLLRRRYQEPACGECVDMEDLIYELESAAGCLDGGATPKGVHSDSWSCA